MTTSTPQIVEALNEIQTTLFIGFILLVFVGIFIASIIHDHD